MSGCLGSGTSLGWSWTLTSSGCSTSSTAPYDNGGPQPLPSALSPLLFHVPSAVRVLSASGWSVCRPKYTTETYTMEKGCATLSRMHRYDEWEELHRRYQLRKKASPQPRAVGRRWDLRKGSSGDEGVGCLTCDGAAAGGGGEILRGD